MIDYDYQTLTPAFGRDYKSGKAAKEDFLGGKDFQMQPQGTYCSIRDFRSGVTVNIRYKQLRQICVVKVP